MIVAPYSPSRHRHRQSLIKGIVLILVLSRMFMQAIAAAALLLSEEDGNEAADDDLLPISNQQHFIRVLAVEFPVSLMTKRNATTGHVLEMSGVLPQILLALSKLYRFSYAYLPITAAAIPPSPSIKGAIDYITNGETDLVLGTLIGKPEVLKLVDYPTLWYASSLAILIPHSTSTASAYSSHHQQTTAIFEPFSIEVWLTALTSLVAITIFLCYFLQCHYKNNYYNRRRRRRNSSRIVLPAIINILSQGGRRSAYYSRSTAIGILACVWCLSCFFLFQSYGCNWTSHLTTSRPLKPLVNSVFDIPNVPGLKITVDRNLAADHLISNSNYGVVKQLGDMLRADSNLRCANTSDCLDKVKSGSHVYIQVASELRRIMETDYRATGECHFAMAKDTFWPLSTFMALAKGSQHTEFFSRGILRLKEAGLIDKWVSEYIPKDAKCWSSQKTTTTTTNNGRNNKNAEPYKPLSLDRLSGAFVVLLVGYCLALLVFAAEIFVNAFYFYAHFIINCSFEIY